MAQLALDDPAALKKLLENCAVPAPTVANLNLLGYRSVALLGFAVPSDGHVDEMIEKLTPHDLGEQIDLLSPGAASLRRKVAFHVNPTLQQQPNPSCLCRSIRN